ncbi:MAG: hypothetical protein ACRYFX_07255 [Janthinobacterium lividum]
MKAWLLTTLLALAPPAGFWLTRVRAHNEAQAQGQVAAARHQPAQAAYYYQQAADLAGRGGPSPALLLDLAQAQAQASQATAARATYSRLLGAAVPAAIGSTARQQLAVLLTQQRQVAQASNLLQQALRLNPANATARYNYEVLARYLAGQQLDNPPLPPPGTGSAPAPPNAPGKTPDKNGPEKRPAEKAGTDHPGEASNPDQHSGGDSKAPRPSATGQSDAQQPSPGTNGPAPGGFRPGAGEQRPVASGNRPGSQRGLDTGAGATGLAATAGHSRRPGTEVATDADLQLQTQRERLKAMNLSPAQAQQLLEALRESEQQYLQQRPRARQGAAPAPGTPTW